LGIGEERNAQAGGAFATEIIGEALAIGGLRKHASKSVFADAARAGEEQCVGDALGAEGAAKGGDDALVAEKFGEAHALPCAFLGARGKYGLDGGEDFRGDFLGRAHGVLCGVDALDGGPGRLTREHVVHFRGVFEVAEIGLLDVLLCAGVAALGFAGDQFLGVARRNAEIEDKIFAWQAVDVVFEMFDPGHECGAFFRGSAGDLMGEVGGNVAVGEDDATFLEGGLQGGFGFEAVAGVEHGREMGIDGIERAEFAVEKFADHFAEPGIVLREADGKDGVATGGEGYCEQLDLGALAASVDAFDGDECAASDHVEWGLERWRDAGESGWQSMLEKQFNP